MGQETRSWGELAIVHKSLCVSRFDSARMEKPSVGRPACWLDFEQSLQLGFEAADDREEAVVEGAIGRDGLSQRNALDLRSVQDDEAAELALVHQIDGRKAVTRRQHAVKGRGSAAPLRVSQVD